MQTLSTPELYALFLQSSGVSTDTRCLQEGEMFFALRGPNFDGNRFALIALERGALWVVIDDETLYQEHQKNSRLIRVNDALEALQKLAAYHLRQLSRLKVLGITGSNGKTTTKNLVAAILAQKFSVFATPGNKNNHIGLPLSALSILPTHDYAVLELGDNRPGEIEELCAIARPNLGLITNIGFDHMEFYRTIEENAATKLALFDYVAARGGALFINGKDSFLSQGAEKNTGGKKIYYNLPPLLNYKIEEARVEGLRLAIYQGNTFLFSIFSRLTGAYNAENILAAIAVGLYHEIEPEKIRAAIENYAPPENRSQYLQLGKHSVILDAYNANPSSVQAALSSLLPAPNPAVALILGDMNELGKFSEPAHRQIAENILRLQPGCFIGIGKWMIQAAQFVQQESKTIAAYGFLDYEAFIEKGLPILSSYAILLIKGSRSLALERIVERLKNNPS
jgi:UDP-N-acetylmuramoyl-tripeptide--D-alanyl-D-alanine ligase